MRRMIHRLLDRRRERRLALELEHRFRAQLNARAEAAARIADDLQLDFRLVVWDGSPDLPCGR